MPIRILSMLVIIILGSCSTLPKGYKLSKFSVNEKNYNKYILNRTPDYGDAHLDGCIIMKEISLQVTYLECIHAMQSLAVEAMKSIDTACLIIVGDGDVVSQLKKTVEENGLSSKVLFFGKQPYLRMMNYTYHASIGLTLDKDTNINYRFSLPNKLFDYIHTNTAVVCTPLVEVKRIVETYEVGKVLEKLTPEALAKTIKSLLENKEELERIQHNCDKAKQALNWEKETEVLKKVYPKIEY